MSRKFLNRLGDAIGDIGRYAADYQIAERDRKYKETQDQGEVDRWERQFAANRGDVAQDREDRLSTERRMGDRAVTAGAMAAEEDANDPVKRAARARARLLESLADGTLGIDDLTEGQKLLVEYSPKAPRLNDVIDERIMSDPALLNAAVSRRVSGGSSKGQPSYSDRRQEANDFKGAETKRMAGQVMSGLSRSNPEVFGEYVGDKVLNPEKPNSMVLRGMLADRDFYGEKKRGGILGFGGESVPRMNPSDSTMLQAIADSLVDAEGTPSMRYAQRRGYFDQQPVDEEDYYDPQSDLYGSGNEADYYPADSNVYQGQAGVDYVPMPGADYQGNMGQYIRQNYVGQNYQMPQAEQRPVVRSIEELSNVPDDQLTDEEIDFYTGALK